MSGVRLRSAIGHRGVLLAAVVIVVVSVLAVLATLVVPADPASAETPAERCARETAAYNSAWAQTWAASNGRPVSEAPPPPVPYVCHDPGPTTTTTSLPPVVTAPTVPSDTNVPEGPGPNMGAHAPTDIPEAGQTPIVPIPGRSGGSVRDQDERAPSNPVDQPAVPSVPVPASPTAIRDATPEAGRNENGRSTAVEEPEANLAHARVPGILTDGQAARPRSSPRSGLLRALESFRHDAQFRECERYEGGYFVNRRICAQVDGDGLYVDRIIISGEGTSGGSTRIRYHIQGPDGSNSTDFEQDVRAGSFEHEIPINSYMEPGEYKLWYQTLDVNGDWSGWDSVDWEVKRA